MPRSLALYAPEPHRSRVSNNTYGAAYQDSTHCLMHALLVDCQHSQSNGKVAAAEFSDEEYMRGWEEAD